MLVIGPALLSVVAVGLVLWRRLRVRCVDGFAFSSGQAATVTMMHTLKAGDHIVSIDDVYAGTQQYFTYVPALWPLSWCDEVCVPTSALPHPVGTGSAVGMGERAP